MNTKLEKLKKQQEKIKSQIKKEEASDKIQNRKYDTRRKILIGAVVMERMKKDRDLSKKVEKILAESLTRDKDRKLFELPALTKEKS